MDKCNKIVNDRIRVDHFTTAIRCVTDAARKNRLLPLKTMAAIMKDEAEKISTTPIGKYR